MFSKSKTPEFSKILSPSDKWFELSGVSFTTDQNRDKPLAEFQAMLSSSNSGTLYVRCDRVSVEFQGVVYKTIDVRFFLNIPSETTVFSARTCPNPFDDRPKVMTEHVDHVATEGGYARVYVAYRFPVYLPEGFLFSVFGTASEIVLKWWKTPPAKVIPMLESSMSRKSAIGGLKESLEVQSLSELAKRLKEGQDILSFILYFVVHAKSKKELDELSRVLEDTLRMYGIEVQAPKFYQANLYDFPEKVTIFGLPLFDIRKTYADTYSMRALFPLIKDSLVDEGGVFIGFSGTGDPVVYNPYRRQNYLFLILGESGSGKSMTSKVYLSRFHQKTGLPVYGIDPESEYTRVAHYFGSVPVEVREGEPLGLDPIRIGLDRVLTAEALGEVYTVPRDLRARLRKELYSTKARNVFEFVENCSGDLKKYLEPMTTPPDSLIFSGDPPDLSSPAIFGLRDLRSDHLKILTTSLISAYMLQNLGTHSAVFVDEGWLFIRTPRIMGVFENLARRGRKYGVHFLFITQRVEDVASTPEGRTLLEQAASAILLRQEREGAELVREIYKLSPEEVDYIVNANPGEGLLKAENSRIFLRVVVTPSEMQAFSTTPFSL